MQLPLYNQNAENVGTVDLSDAVFAVPSNRDLLYQVITSQMANRRQPLAHAKGRSEVRGGGKKPWQQKGTGRARHGSIRSPIWKGGGVTHGPLKERSFKRAITKSMLHKALVVALSQKVRDHQLVIVDAIAPANGKTKEVASVMNNFKSLFGNRLSSILLVVPEKATGLYKASRNLPYIDTIEADNINPLHVLSSTYVLMPQAALEAIEKNWTKKK